MARRSVALLLVAAAAAAGIAHGRPAGEPRASLVASSGTFEQVNSRAGQAIFTAPNVGPGDTASGSVTISNSGTLGGSFTLSAADVDDLEGPGGLPLSQRLQVRVRDVTGSPATVYSGSLAGMPPRTLGWFAPGEARTYDFTAAFPHGSSDNAYEGASASVRYVWSAAEAPPPPTPPPPRPPPWPSPPAGSAPPPAAPAARDVTPPRLRLAVPRVQRVLSNWRVAVRARCNEACRITLRGRLAVPGRRGQVAVRPIRGRRAQAGRSTVLRIVIPARTRPGVRRALLARRVVTLRVRVLATDRAGNTTEGRRVIRLRLRAR